MQGAAVRVVNAVGVTLQSVDNFTPVRVSLDADDSEHLVRGDQHLAALLGGRIVRNVGAETRVDEEAGGILRQMLSVGAQHEGAEANQPAGDVRSQKCLGRERRVATRHLTVLENLKGFAEVGVKGARVKSPLPFSSPSLKEALHRLQQTRVHVYGHRMAPLQVAVRRRFGFLLRFAPGSPVVGAGVQRLNGGFVGHNRRFGFALSVHVGTQVWILKSRKIRASEGK